ncbi:MAG TPA: protein kinase [Kofleriaceae bacterium]|nr:protein kinase [Kofleriaceae bacterium]
MSSSSSGVGSVPVPSGNPDEVQPWERDGWQASYRADGPPREGGFGAVLPVIHLASGERRALKHPLHVSDEALARFKREIEVQRKITHPNIMPILDVDPAFEWFAMPWASRSFYEAARGMSDDELATAFTAAALGLHAAHRAGYVHRDVKPSNLVDLTDDHAHPAWVVSDFGIVRRPPGQTTNLKTTHALGTDGFIAPEVALGGRTAKVTPRADIYSLGRMIAWATTGVYPARFDPLAARGHWAPLAERMTAFEPDERPGTMLEIVAGIRAVLAAQRAERHAAWGERAPGALSALEEALLAAVFEEASEPGDDGEDIAIGVEPLKRHARSQAALRVSLKHLVELGFLVEHRPRGQPRTYSPTARAWAWAQAHAEQLAAPDSAPF